MLFKINNTKIIDKLKISTYYAGNYSHNDYWNVWLTNTSAFICAFTLTRIALTNKYIANIYTKNTHYLVYININIENNTVEVYKSIENGIIRKADRYIKKHEKLANILYKLIVIEKLKPEVGYVPIEEHTLAIKHNTETYNFKIHADADKSFTKYFINYTLEKTTEKFKTIEELLNLVCKNSGWWYESTDKICPEEDIINIL